MNFPTSPTVGQTYTLGSKTWVWNGSAWDLQINSLTYTPLASATSSDGSIVVTQTGDNIDLVVSEASPASTLLAAVRNTTGATLTKGTAVYISGATGQISTVSKALATADSTSAQTLGLITADLANNSNGYVTVIGLVSNINTSAYTDGAQLYLSPTTAGTLTATKPYAPQHLVYVAVVEHAHPTQGKLFVKVQNGYEMDELHDVSAQSPSNGNTLVYNTSNSLWESTSTLPGSYTLSGGTANGVTYLNGSKVLTSGSALTFDGTNLAVTQVGNPTMTVKTTGAGNNPLYRLQADTNYWDALGVFSDANDTLRFRYNGTDYLTLNNTGAVGVGSSISYGTSGQVLTSAGSGSAPTWATPSAGALVFLSSQTVTSGVASVDFTNVLSSTYDDYIVYFDAMVFSSTSARFYLRIEKSGSFQTTNNGYSYTPLKNATTVTPVVNAAAAEIRLADGSTTTNATWGGSILFTNANGASFVTVIVSDLYITGSASTMARYVSGGFNETASNATGFQLYPSTGTMTAGNFRLYGIKKS